MNLTEDQVISLAPDASSVKSGKELANHLKWVLLQQSEAAIWGHCQGSGKEPYKTAVDITNIAFKCSCPSRKFPCKHGLGILLLYAKQASQFKHNTPPQWVNEWISRRAAAVEINPAQEKKQVNTETQARRAEQRLKKVQEGVEEIQVWIKDVIRNGLLVFREKSPAIWKNMHARMIDAQAPGIAGMLYEFGEINYFAESWGRAVMKNFTDIYMLAKAFENIALQPADLQDEIRSRIGWNVSQQDLKNTGTPIRDKWLVLGKELSIENDLQTERCWLLGSRTNKYAVILSFAVNGNNSGSGLITGTSIDAELIYYPGSKQLRALLKEIHGTSQIINSGGYTDISDMLKDRTAFLKENPWIRRHPALIKNVCAEYANGSVHIKDINHHILPVRQNNKSMWNLLAISGGLEIDVFGIVQEEQFFVISCFSGQQFNRLQ